MKLLAWFGRRRRREQDLDEEIRAHMAMAIRERIEQGESPAEAEANARREFGNATLVKEVTRDMWGWRWLETLLQDIRYGLRQLRRNPGFTAVAVITLALGIGANTAIFSVVNAVLLQSLPYRDPGRLAVIAGGATPVRYEEIRAAARSYTELGAFAGGAENVAISGGAAPESLKEARVSANFLNILGVNPLLGRSFLPGDDQRGGRKVAMISASLWRRRFAGDPRIVGRAAILNLRSYTIVGVLPVGFEFPFPGADVWRPRPSEWSGIPPKYRRISPFLELFGRLRPGVSFKQASAELALLDRQYATAHPLMLDAKPHWAARETTLKGQLVSDIRPMLWMLFGAVAFVLLIACANVASLLMARASVRSQEFAVRAALGAGRARVIRQLLVEGLLLACSGGALGALLAEWTVNWIAHTSALALPRIAELRIDGVVLGFTLAVSMATGTLSGLMPSLWASRRDLVEALRERGAAAALGSRRQNALGLSTRSLLVMGQAALSVVLLIGAALLMKSLVRLEQVNPGFEPDNVLTMQVSLPLARYNTAQKRAKFFGEVVQQIDSVPGVHSAAVTWMLPMTGYASSPIAVVEQPPIKFNTRPLSIIESVTPEYFQTLRIPLKRGREFTRDDVQSSPPVAVISENLARRFWPAYPNGENPVGQHIFVGADPQPVQIVGIVADVHQASLDTLSQPELYLPYAQRPFQSAMLAVRTQGSPSQFANVVRKRIQAIDPDQPVSAVKAMTEVVHESLGQPRLMALLIATFAGLALLLATVGIYGVVSYSAAQRTREIGVRVALGAQRSDILRLILGQGVRLALVGVVIGEIGAVAVTRVLKSLLFDVSATDTVTFAAIAVAFVSVTLLACYVPARRATKVDPIVALRYE